MSSPEIHVFVTQCIDFGKFDDEALRLLRKNSTKNVKIVLVDNGSYIRIRSKYADEVLRFDKNVGGNAIPYYATMTWYGKAPTAACFFHADLMVVEKGWDRHVLQAFQNDPKLALLGFVGSNEIDTSGGRGMGTMLNFQGKKYGLGKGTPAEVHGRRITVKDGPQPAAVLDFCAQVYRADLIPLLIPYWKGATVMHFEDRIVPCEYLSRGYHVAVLGVACDHLSGGKQWCEKSYKEAILRWMEKHPDEEPEEFEGFDNMMYLISEYRFLTKWRGRMGFVPVRVDKDYKLSHD